MMLLPRQIGDAEAERLGIMAGWWAVAPEGAPVSGPYPTEEAAKVGIAKRGSDQPDGRPGEAGPPPQE